MQVRRIVSSDWHFLSQFYISWVRKPASTQIYWRFYSPCVTVSVGPNYSLLPSTSTKRVKVRVAELQPDLFYLSLTPISDWSNIRKVKHSYVHININKRNIKSTAMIFPGILGGNNWCLWTPPVHLIPTHLFPFGPTGTWRAWAASRAL